MVGVYRGDGLSNRSLGLAIAGDYLLMGRMVEQSCWQTGTVCAQPSCALVVLRRTVVMLIPLALFAGTCSDSGDTANEATPRTRRHRERGDTANEATTAIAPTTTMIEPTTTMIEPTTTMIETAPIPLDLGAAKAAAADFLALTGSSGVMVGADQILSPDGIDVAEDRSGDYGFATQIVGQSFFGHSGSIIGSRTLAAHHRERDLAIVPNANFDSFERQDAIVLAEALLAGIG